MLNFIWAEDQSGSIGYHGTMPWHSHEDMVHFRKLTTGHPVIMGRKTFESMGRRPLPHRMNYVLSRSANQIKGVTVLNTIADVKRVLAKTQGEIFVIGGATVFKQLMPLADRLYQTILDQTYPSDTKMPPLEQQRWRLVKQEKFQASRDGEPNCTFNTWELATQ